MAECITNYTAARFECLVLINVGRLASSWSGTLTLYSSGNDDDED